MSELYYIDIYNCKYIDVYFALGPDIGLRDILHLGTMTGEGGEPPPTIIENRKSWDF